jgi:hypothetical protein
MEWRQWAYLALAGGAVWLLHRIFELVKAIHFMMHEDFKRRHSEAIGED